MLKDSSTLETTSDKLWLMSEKEAFGTNEYSSDGEGVQYPIFTDDASRIKKINGFCIKKNCRMKFGF